MKRYRFVPALAIVASFLILLLCGCTSKPALSEKPNVTVAPTPEALQTQTVQQTESSTDIIINEISVSTVDEFLNAIAPDTTIILKPGTYTLSEAENYGSEALNAWYKWQNCYDGYELVISDVSNLKITAESPDNTIIDTAPRYADVLYFDGCSNIELSNFTAGHTDLPAVCNGGVIKFNRCENVNIGNCAMFGCGIIGIEAETCSNINVVSSRIYDCTWNAVKLASCHNILFDSCEFYLCGDGQQLSCVFEYANCNNIAVLNSRVYENDCASLLSSNASTKVSFGGTAFYDNSAAYAINATNYSPLIYDCSFRNNNFSDWYSEDTTITTKAIDNSGQELSEELFESMQRKDVSFSGFDTANASTEIQEVYASSIGEFLEAIAPNTTVYLSEGIYDVAPDNNLLSSDYYHWEEVYDGYQLVIKNVDNFQIIGSGKSDCIFSAAPRYATVLSFANCKDLYLEGFTAGHTEEPGACSGNVLALSYCENIAVDSCGLYGCGVIGIFADSCKNLEVKHTEIYDCSWIPAELRDVDNASFIDCDIHDCGSNEIRTQNCDNLIIK